MKNNQGNSPPKPKGKVGGARPGAGRKKGSINKVGADLRSYARQYSEEAIQGIVSLAKKSKNEGIRLRAYEILLDRGFGKPSQSVEMTGSMTLTHEQALDALK